MKHTLLDVVQMVLSSLDSDEVNSITDTTESMQVAYLAKQTYLDIASIGGLPETKTLFELNASTDPLLPTVMYLPQNIQNIDWIKYNKATADDPTANFLIVDYMPLEDFLHRMYRLLEDQPNTIKGSLPLNGDNITLLWKDNVAPLYWTSFNDHTILFDSYDSGVDTTLQKSKSLGYGVQSYTFVMEDSYIPNLDEPQHQLWLNETKALAWAELKQATNQRVEQKVRKGWVNLSHSKQAAPTRPSPLDKAPDYGRKGAAAYSVISRGRNQW